MEILYENIALGNHFPLSPLPMMSMVCIQIDCLYRTVYACFNIDLESCLKNKNCSNILLFYQPHHDGVGLEIAFTDCELGTGKLCKRELCVKGSFKILP